MGDTSIGIKIAVDSGQVKTNLDKVQADFVSASAKITKALQSIQGFSDLKKQTEETSKAYAEAQQKVAALAKEIKSGAGGAALAKDFERAKVEAGRLKESLGSQQQQLQQVRTAMAGAGVSTSGLAGQQTALRLQLDATRQKYAELARVAAARDTLNLTPHIEITAEINKARAAYATLAASGKLSMAELAQAKVTVRERIDELTRHTNGWRDALGQIKGNGLEAAAAFGGIIIAARQAIAFETAMAEVSKTVDGTKEQIAALGVDLRNMSLRVPLPVEELAEIAAAGGQLGVASKDILAFTDVTAKMATAFKMTADAAGQAIGTMANVWQLPVAEIERFGDAINYLGNNTATTEPKIVDVLLRIGGTARQFGLAKEQAAALAAAMLSLGQTPEVASTSINALLVRMQTATKQSDSFKEALGQIGLSAEQMANMVVSNPQKALDTLLATLSKLQGRQRAEVLTGLFGAEYQDNISVLVGSLESYQKALGLVSDQTKYAGSMNKEFETRLGTTKSQLQLLWQTLTEVVRSIGDGFLPAINLGSTLLRGMLTPIAALAREVPGLAAALVSLGTGLLVYGTVTKILGILKLALVSVGSTAVVSLGQITAGATTMLATLATLNPALTILVATLGAGALAWKIFGGDAFESSQKHAAAASSIGAVVEGINKEVAELGSLQKVLLETGEGTAAHVAAEEKLATILPTANKSLDEQGRILASVKGATSENNKALQEYINLKNAEARVQTGLQIEQQAKAYFKGKDAVAQYVDNLKQWYGIGTQTTTVAQSFWLSLNRLTGTYESNIKKGSEMRENLSKQKSEFESLLRSMAKSGATVDEVNEMLSGIKIDEATKGRILSEYKTMFAAISDEAKKSSSVQLLAHQKSASGMKQATGDALKEMQKKYQEYAAEVRRLQDEISGRERSLASELRALSRTGMTDAQAWDDQKREAKEYETAAKQAATAAQAAFAQGDTITAGAQWKTALEYADQAKQAYAGLNTEVKSGEKVVVTQQEALKTAMDGVKASGELAVSILKQQQEAANGAMNALTEKSGFANLAKGMDEAEQKWLDNWQNMRDKALRELVVVEERIQKIVDKDRTVYINVKTVEERSTGGLIRGYHLGGAIRALARGRAAVQALATGGGVRNILAGGHLPGFGGGDTVPLWGEAGEYMINKWASLKAGLPALQHLNAGDIGAAIAELTKRLKTNFGYRLGGMVQSVAMASPQRLATGGGVAGGGGMMTINLDFGGGVSVPVTSTKANARVLEREFKRRAWRSSQ